MLYNFDLKKIKQKKIIILGETHGVAENVEIIKTFVDSLEAEGISVTIALEWPTEINSDIQAFLNNQEIAPSWQRWNFVQDKDGRVSKEHIAFLQWLKARNKILLPDKKHNIFCFSEEQESWNTRDLKMAQNIKSILNNHNQKVILAVMGNLHARKKEIEIDGKVCAPLATHLPKKDIVAFKCDYLCGSFFNHTLKSFKSCKECDNKSIFIKPALTKEFDYHIITPRAHAVTLLGSSS
ncbi:hypothetical protein KKF47_03590 [Patescibacteria group bacterium]|nr:hypothetical protein [Patescibacteria group bacterium]MBU4467111.1 hypothetical protein [Patescibacteria group bacterium]MCG2699789.1 hypothetical protein [Candidatus Parcubacteria bacterium]